MSSSKLAAARTMTPPKLRLKDDALTSMYRKVLPDPHAQTIAAGWPNAEFALRMDLLQGRTCWTGHCWLDMKYALWFKHPLFSVFYVHTLDPLGRFSRFLIIATQAFVASVKAFFKPHIMAKLRKDPELGAYKEDLIVVLQSSFIALSAGFISFFSKCACVKTCRWKWFRRFFECFGKAVVLLMACLVICGFWALSMVVGEPVEFITTICMELGLAWAFNAVESSGLFLLLYYCCGNCSGKTSYEYQLEPQEGGGGKWDHYYVNQSKMEASGLRVESTTRWYCMLCCTPLWLLRSDRRDWKLVPNAPAGSSEPAYTAVVVKSEAEEEEQVLLEVEEEGLEEEGLAEVVAEQKAA